MTLSRADIFAIMAAFGITYASAISLYRDYRKLDEKYKKLHSVTTYLVDMLVENDVPMTDFDLIALSELGVKFNLHDEEPHA